MLEFLRGFCAQFYNSLPQTEAYSEVRLDGTVVEKACKEGNADIVEKFLKQNTAWAKQQNDKKESNPLGNAARGGYPEIIALLCRHGMDPGQEVTESGATALHIAAQNGRSEAVWQLLSLGVNIDTPRQHDKGITALHLAAFNGHSKVIHELMSHNPAGASPEAIDVNRKDNEGYTPLMLAYLYRHDDVKTALKQYGAEHSPECLSKIQSLKTERLKTGKTNIRLEFYS